MWRASRHRGTLVFAPVIEDNWKDQECRKGLGCLSPPPYPALILPNCFAPFVISLSSYRLIGIQDKMKRLFAVNTATQVENGKKNLIARKSPQLLFLVNATSKFPIDIEPITASLSSAEAPARYPYKNSNNRKIESARGTMGREKRRGGLSSFFPLPIVPCALSFFVSLPSFPTTQGGLCGGDSYRFYKRKQWGRKDDAVVRKSPFTRVVWPRIPVPGRVCCWFNTIAFSALASNKWH